MLLHRGRTLRRDRRVRVGRHAGRPARASPLRDRGDTSHARRARSVLGPSGRSPLAGIHPQVDGRGTAHRRESHRRWRDCLRSRRLRPGWQRHAHLRHPRGNELLRRVRLPVGNGDGSVELRILDDHDERRLLAALRRRGGRGGPELLGPRSLRVVRRRERRRSRRLGDLGGTRRQGEHHPRDLPTRRHTVQARRSQRGRISPIRQRDGVARDL